MSINIRTGKGWKKARRRLQRIEGILATMSQKTDQTITILTDVSTKVTTFVTAQTTKYDDLKKAYDLQVQQNTLLKSEDDADKAQAVALQSQLDDANTKAEASAAADDADEQKVLDAATALQTFAGSLGDSSPEDPTQPTVGDPTTPSGGPTTDPTAGGDTGSDPSGAGETTGTPPVQTDPTSDRGSSPVTTPSTTDDSGSTSSGGGE